MKEKKSILKYLPVMSVMSIVILVATIFANNTIVQKSMSLTETETVTCTASNYSDFTSNPDAVCSMGYKYLSGECKKKSVTNYTCPSGESYNSTVGKCTYDSTKYCGEYANGTCNCYKVVNGQTIVVNDIPCKSNETCSEACTVANDSNLNPGTNSGNGDESWVCGQTSSGPVPTFSLSCDGDKKLYSKYCYSEGASSQSSQNNECVSVTVNVCQNGGSYDSTIDKCTHDEPSSSSATTTIVYSGEITCTAVEGTSDFQLSLISQESTIKIGETKEITAKIEPSEFNQDVTWTSSDETIATVDENGTVVGLSVGTATITATTVDGKKSATAKINVVDEEVTDTNQYYIDVEVVNGKIYPSDPNERVVNEGSSIDITYSPDKGYELSEIIITKGEETPKKVSLSGNETKYTFSDVRDDYTIKVVFIKNSGTGLFEVGGVLLAFIVFGGVVYYVIKKRQLLNI